MTPSIDDGEHPRLFVTEEGIARLKQTVQSGTPKWLYDRLIDQCDKHVATVDLSDSRWSRPVGEKGGHAGFWENPRDILDTSLGYALSGDKGYRDLALNMIDSMIGWQTWFHRYEPDRGVMLQSMAMAYDLLYHSLGQDRAQALRQMINAECRDMLSYLHERGQQHKHSHNTAGARTFTSFGIAVLSILTREWESAGDGEAEVLTEWLDLARDGVACWIRAGLDEDGGTRYVTEGSYNVSAIGHILAFVIAYRNIFGCDPCDLGRLRKYVLFSLYKLEPQRDGMGQFGTGGRVSSYAPETMIGLMRLFDDGLARWFFDVYYGPDADLERFHLDDRDANCSESCYVLPLLYWKEVAAEAPDRSPRLERAASFRGSGKAVMRTGFESSDDLQLMLQCQSPQHGHSSADVGNFTLNALGERFIDDPGCAGGSPDMPRGCRWGSYPWSCSPGAHNLVLIDGVAEHTHSFGTIPDFLHGEAADYLMAEMKPAYDARSPVRRAQRHVVFVRPSYFVIIDDVCKDDQVHDYELILHEESRHPLEDMGANQFLWRHDRANLLVAFAHPADVRHSAPDAAQVARQAEEGNHKDWSLWPGVLEKKNPQGKSRLEMPEHQNFVERMRNKSGVPPMFSFRSAEARNEGLFFTLLYPVRKGRSVPHAVPSSTSDMVSMTIDGRDTVIFNRKHGVVEAQVAGDIEDADVATDAAVCHTRVEDGRLVQWLAARATAFRHSRCGFTATEPVTLTLRGATGRCVTARETALTIEFPGIEGVELDGVPVPGAGLRENGMTIRLPAGDHRLQIIIDPVDALFRERE